jgi:hypothetical protein
MKLAIASAILASAFSLALAAPALALPPQVTYETVCTSTSNGGEVPMGVQADSNGRKWAGYKANGMPPDSLSSGGSTSTSCVEVAVQQDIT